ncbi:DUF4234 domain-containing protein [Klenkia sp. LSe6-5]|uniref:DUF4234 domain-containing protein n=1 Tax=Klenkia sesuvii TaxID=3103137 RepID=A0ABU8DXJ1_9ACTN
MSTIDGQNTQPSHSQPQYGQPQYAQPQYGQPQYAPAPVQQSYGYAPVPMQSGPVGKVRSTWAVIGLSIITFGIYGFVYYFSVHEEIKRHSGEGVGGAVGLIIALFTLGLVTPFLLPNEVGNLYARQGRPRPVTATTGLWVLLGSFILIGPLVWLVKTNGALNAYWRSVGAR